MKAGVIEFIYVHNRGNDITNSCGKVAVTHTFNSLSEWAHVVAP